LQGETGWWNDQRLLMIGFVHTVSGDSQARTNAVWYSPDKGNTWTTFLIDSYIGDGGYGSVLYNPVADQYVIWNYRGTLDEADVVQYNVSLLGVEPPVDYSGEADMPLTQWSMVEGTTDISLASAAWTDMTDMSITLTTEGGPVEIEFTGGVGNSTGDGVGRYRLVIDGAQAGQSKKIRIPTASVGADISLKRMLTLSAASHTFKVQWYTESGTLQNRAASENEDRVLIVKEFST
jgi:hypothetical protein